MKAILAVFALVVMLLAGCAERPVEASERGGVGVEIVVLAVEGYGLCTFALANDSWSSGPNGIALVGCRPPSNLEAD